MEHGACIYCDGLAPDRCAKCGAGDEAGWAMRSRDSNAAHTDDALDFSTETMARRSSRAQASRRTS